MGAQQSPVSKPPTSATPPEPRTIAINIPPRPYDAVVGPGLLSSLGERTRRALSRPATRAFVVYDSNLPAVVVEAAQRSLAAAGFQLAAHAARAGEQSKSLDSLRSILEGLASHRQERHEPVIALGGGMVGDLTGFAASIYKRGVPVIQCPTTLLAMVDASIGGKTAVNLEVGGDATALHKNIVGSFHQPVLVLADTGVLVSLPAREFRAGLAEMIKHGLLGGQFGDPTLFADIEQSIASLTPRGIGETDLIARNIAIKGRVVEADPFETAPDDVGGRALLNLGHTFAHAIETLPGLTLIDEQQNTLGTSPILHGEAVGLGLIAAACSACEEGHCEPNLIDRLKRLVQAAGLPRLVQGLPSNKALISRMMHDKKVVGNRLRVILPAHNCRAKVYTVTEPTLIAEGWDAVRGD